MFVQGRRRGLAALVLMLAATACRAQTNSNTWSTQQPAETEISSQLDEALIRLSQRPEPARSYGEPGLIAQPDAPSLGQPNALPRHGEPTPADPPADLSQVPFDKFHFVPDENKQGEDDQSPQATETPLPRGGRRGPNLTVGQGGYPIIDNPRAGTVIGGSGCDAGVCGTSIFCDAPCCVTSCDPCCVSSCGRKNSPFGGLGSMFRNFGMGRCGTGSGSGCCPVGGCAVGGCAVGGCPVGGGCGVVSACGSGCNLGGGCNPGGSLFGNRLGRHPWSRGCGGGGRCGSFYGGIDYLYWWTRGMRIPTLSTTSPVGTPPGEAGLNGYPTTTNLFGPGRLDGDGHSGVGVRLGYMFDACGCHGIEADYFVLGESSFRHYARTPEDYAILARPFYNTNTGAEDAELVGYPGLVDGSLVVRGSTDFQGGGILYRKNLLCCQPACCDPCDPCGDLCGNSCGPCGTSCGGGRFGWLHRSCDWLNGRLPGHGCLKPTRVDGLVGWRAFDLDESLTVRENRISTDPVGVVPVGTTFDIYDAFRTENTFNGVVFGTDAQWCTCGKWGIGSRLRVSLGELQRRAAIQGATTINTPGVGETYYDAGLMALSTNSGHYSDDLFVAIPEVGLNVYYTLGCKARVNFGYTFLYMSDVWRPGDVIDQNIDPRQQPPPTVATADSPRFAPRSDDFWAQGINLGLEFRY